MFTRKTRRYWWRGLLLSLLCIGSLQMWCAWQVYVYAQPQSPPEYADAAVVLGAAAWGNRPSPVFRERINHALSLYQTGHTNTLIFTGGTPKAGFDTEAEVARQFALKQGIPAHDILFESRSKDTYQNLANTHYLMRKHHLNSVIIISDPFHMARAMTMAKHLGINAYSSPTPTSLYSRASFKKRAEFFIQESYALFIYRLLYAARQTIAWLS